jgi:hypothetical protein
MTLRARSSSVSSRVSASGRHARSAGATSTSTLECSWSGGPTGVRRRVASRGVSCSRSQRWRLSAATGRARRSVCSPSACAWAMTLSSSPMGSASRCGRSALSGIRALLSRAGLRSPPVPWLEALGCDPHADQRGRRQDHGEPTRPREPGAAVLDLQPLHRERRPDSRSSARRAPRTILRVIVWTLGDRRRKDEGGNGDRVTCRSPRRMRREERRRGRSSSSSPDRGGHGLPEGCEVDGTANSASLTLANSQGNTEQITVAVPLMNEAGTRGLHLGELPCGTFVHFSAESGCVWDYHMRHPRGRRAHRASRVVWGVCDRILFRDCVTRPPTRP